MAAAVAAEDSRRAFGEGLNEYFALPMSHAGAASDRKLLLRRRGSAGGGIGIAEIARGAVRGLPAPEEARLRGSEKHGACGFLRLPVGPGGLVDVLEKAQFPRLGRVDAGVRLEGLAGVGLPRAMIVADQVQ